jgi:hypothetical protein
MRKLHRDSEVLKIIEDTMPGAKYEEQMQATHEFWQFFDAVWAIADRLLTEREKGGK